MPLPPPPVKAPVTPDDAPVTDLVAISPYAMNDDDGDGRGSAFPVAVYLYSQPFPAPKWQAGSFTLSLFKQGAAPERGEANGAILAKRSWTAEEAMTVRNRSLVGDFYRFVIDLSDAEVRPNTKGLVEYRICFIPDSGEHPVYSSVKTIRAR